MTGKLGEVLKESVDVARSWINANAERYGRILKSDYSTQSINYCRLGVDSLLGKDVHVHLPAGAVGKVR